MTNPVELSDNELSELLQMMNELLDTVEKKFLHVKDYTPEITKVLNHVHSELFEESLRRENQL